MRLPIQTFVTRKIRWLSLLLFGCPSPAKTLTRQDNKKIAATFVHFRLTAPLRFITSALDNDVHNRSSTRSLTRTGHPEFHPHSDHPDLFSGAIQFFQKDETTISGAHLP
jgi:hypothetical protein